MQANIKGQTSSLLEKFKAEIINNHAFDMRYLYLNNKWLSNSLPLT